MYSYKRPQTDKRLKSVQFGRIAARVGLVETGACRARRGDAEDGFNVVHGKVCGAAIGNGVPRRDGGLDAHFVWASMINGIKCRWPTR